MWMYVIIGLALLLYFFYYQNNALVISEYEIRSDKLTQQFHGYRIVQLSDLHNKSFGHNQGKLVSTVAKEHPDVIVFTGDLVDSSRYDEKPSLLLMEQLVQIAPVYYVTGNHEWRAGTFASLEQKLKNIGVRVMRNAAANIAVGDDTIQLIGIDDPAGGTASHAEKLLQGLEGDRFRILLAHRPERFPLYADYGVDVVFSGHAHGGQIRLPFVGGLIAPGQGLFPTYTAGTYRSNNTTMIVNRGLGNSAFPLRIFNRPEIVTVTLRR